MATYNLVQFVFDREGLSAGEDVAVITCHIRQVVAGAPDIIPITDEGRDDFVADVTAWWDELQSWVAQQITFRELRFYDVPASAGPPMGDPVRIEPIGQPGTGSSGPLPPQIAVSVTYKTDKRLTWGRHYLPGPTRAMLDNSGRLTSDAGDGILSSSHHLTDRGGTGAALTVFSRKEWTHHDPQTIQVDDIFDVIRSRRYEMPLFRKTASAG
jgi:hypothetical protein